MADIRILDEKTIRISVGLEDALSMIREAESDLQRYAQEIVTIADKMPVFEYTSFCFYAYDSAALFEKMLGMDPRVYTSFSLDAPDAFFYALYGGMSALKSKAVALLKAA
ncbi:hypothetical protein [Gorillibacterium sp. sgz5001074]|uniref:hypothetical protein n=1 Tax=Gorillibacterium sp. sgz5001074 TaxID=3446695 RepID=UPI003F664B99